jgi:hypothetical protein
VEHQVSAGKLCSKLNGQKQETESGLMRFLPHDLCVITQQITCFLITFTSLLREDLPECGYKDKVDGSMAFDNLSVYAFA